MLVALSVPWRMALRTIARVRPSIWATVATDRTRNLNTTLWYCYLNHTARERGLQGVGGLEAFFRSWCSGRVLRLTTQNRPPSVPPEAKIPTNTHARIPGVGVCGRGREPAHEAWLAKAPSGVGGLGNPRVPGVRVTPVTGRPRG
jgi:hypothetical protein